MPLHVQPLKTFIGPTFTHKCVTKAISNILAILFNKTKKQNYQQFHVVNHRHEKQNVISQFSFISSFFTPILKREIYFRQIALRNFSILIYYFKYLGKQRKGNFPFSSFSTLMLILKSLFCDKR